jgi:hypothetical protein
MICLEGKAHINPTLHTRDFSIAAICASMPPPSATRLAAVWEGMKLESTNLNGSSNVQTEGSFIAKTCSVTSSNVLH